MPASAGRVRMPHNNRMHSSATLKMTGIWKDTIGYDPYAAENEKKEANETTYEQAKGLMALAKLSNKSNEVRGACKKCGMVGHLTFQCRNHLGIEDKQNFAASDSSASSDFSSDEEEDNSEEDKNEKRSSSHYLASHGRSRSRSRSRSHSRKVRRRDRSASRRRTHCGESRHRKISSFKRRSSSIESEQASDKQCHGELSASKTDKKRKSSSKKHKEKKDRKEKDRKHRKRHHRDQDSYKSHSKRKRRH